MTLLAKYLVINKFIKIFKIDFQIYRKISYQDFKSSLIMMIFKKKSSKKKSKNNNKKNKKKKERKSEGVFTFFFSILLFC